jgi:hypothetical protein
VALFVESHLESKKKRGTGHFAPFPSNPPL